MENDLGFAPKENLETSCPHGYHHHKPTAEENNRDKKAGHEQQKGLLIRFVDGMANFG